MKKGFTIVELLVYVATLSIVLTLSLQFVTSIIEASAKSVAKEEVQANSSAIIQNFDFLVRYLYFHRRRRYHHLCLFAHYSIQPIVKTH